MQGTSTIRGLVEDCQSHSVDGWVEWVAVLTSEDC